MESHPLNLAAMSIYTSKDSYFEKGSNAGREERGVSFPETYLLWARWLLFFGGGGGGAGGGRTVTLNQLQVAVAGAQ